MIDDSWTISQPSTSSREQELVSPLLAERKLQRRSGLNLFHGAWMTCDSLKIWSNITQTISSLCIFKTRMPIILSFKYGGSLLRNEFVLLLWDLWWVTTVTDCSKNYSLEHRKTHLLREINSRKLVWRVLYELISVTWVHFSHNKWKTNGANGEISCFHKKLLLFLHVLVSLVCPIVPVFL